MILSGIKGKHFLFYQLEISPAILCEKFAALFGSFSLFKTPVDRAIEVRLMETMQPAQLELALLALDKVLDREDEVEMSWKLSLERAQYEVDRAQRQHDLAEPENRLVVRSLEARWNEKMMAFNNLREGYDRYRANRSWRPTAKDKEDILALAEDLPRIWRAPTTEAKDRKRIVRLLIEDVTVNCQPGQKNVSLGLRWRNNFCEVLHVKKPLPPYMMRKHTAETVQIIGTLAHNLTDNQIAVHLNESGYRTPEGRLFTKASVSWLRYRYRIQGPGGDGFTVKEVANRYDISTHVVYYWLYNGIIKGTKLAPGWPWNIILNDEIEKTLSEWVENSKHIAKINQLKI
ncbi:MAG TPA: hypothetical protein DEH07_12145 [Desulfotomaculum sp.]|nr:hypothetical protein [Desulfotomaculum sp.]